MQLQREVECAPYSGARSSCSASIVRTAEPADDDLQSASGLARAIPERSQDARQLRRPRGPARGTRRGRGAAARRSRAPPATRARRPSPHTGGRPRSRSPPAASGAAVRPSIRSSSATRARRSGVKDRAPAGDEALQQRGLARRAAGPRPGARPLGDSAQRSSAASSATRLTKTSTHAAGYSTSDVADMRMSATLRLRVTVSPAGLRGGARARRAIASRIGPSSKRSTSSAMKPSITRRLAAASSEAARAQVEDLLRVDLGDRRRVRAADVVGQDLEARDRVGVRLLGEQQVAALLERVGLLGARVDLDHPAPDGAASGRRGCRGRRGRTSCWPRRAPAACGSRRAGGACGA